MSIALASKKIHLNKILQVLLCRNITLH